MKPMNRTLALMGRSRQEGISLLVVMILLVLTAILGIVIMRSSAMQERMTANLRDRSIAFQAAEATLRFAQDQVLGGGAWDVQVPNAGTCGSQSICPSGSAPNWRPMAVWDARLAAAPEYWIEYIGTGQGQPGGCDTTSGTTLNCSNPLYRVTARSRAVGRADVVVQATIISRIPEPGT